MVKNKPKNIPIEAVKSPLSTGDITFDNPIALSEDYFRKECEKIEQSAKEMGWKDFRVEYDMEHQKYVCVTEDTVWESIDGKDWSRVRPSQEFVKKDSGKLKWSLMPFEELKDVVKVLMHGAEKYSADNWKKCDDTTRYKDALMRHVVAYVSGEKTDEEFGLSHLAHAICNCLFLMWFDNNKKEEE